MRANSVPALLPPVRRPQMKLLVVRPRRESQSLGCDHRRDLRPLARHRSESDTQAREAPTSRSGSSARGR